MKFLANVKGVRSKAEFGDGGDEFPFVEMRWRQ
jgi:hypothetical protein